MSADAKPRVSTPFLLFARPDAPLNPPRGLAREWSEQKHSLATMLPNSLRAQYGRRLAASRGGTSSGSDEAQHAVTVTSGEFVLAKVRETPSVTFDKLYNSNNAHSLSLSDRKSDARSDSAASSNSTTASSERTASGDAEPESDAERQRRAILSGVRGMQMMGASASAAQRTDASSRLSMDELES